MGADAPMMRSRQRGHRTCHHPWCGPDDERPARERHDERREWAWEADAVSDPGEWCMAERARGRSWREIAAEVSETRGVEVSPSTVQAWYRAHLATMTPTPPYPGPGSNRRPMD